MNKKLFIHIPKNGGMTIRHAPELKNVVFAANASFHKSTEYTNELNMTMALNNDHPGHEHARFRDLHSWSWNNLEPFAIIRNPWDRVVSRYFFAKKVIEVERKVDPSYADVSSFEAFIDERHKWGNKKYMWHRAVRGWYPALDYVTNENGNIVCDILRFEHYNDDYQRYFGLKSPPRARNVTALNKRNYFDIYTNTTKNIIGDWYESDVKTFGYDFMTGPTKNCLYS